MSRAAPASDLHIGFLMPDLSHRHGWGHYSLSLLRALQRTGVRVTVVAAGNSPDVDGIDIHRLLPAVSPAERYNLLKIARAVPPITRTLRSCNLIHSTIEPYAPAGAWIAGRRPFLVTAHGSYIKILPHRRWPAGAVYRQSLYRAQMICVSRYTAEVAKAVLPGIQTEVVNNGIDIERFADLSHQADLKQVPTVLSVGAVKRRKGTLELVQAMAEVRKRVPQARCIIIGSLDAEPDYVERVRQTIEQLNLSPCIHLLGHVSSFTLAKWYAEADVFAVPALNIGDKFEGYGLVYLEASAAGLPVIGTTGCGAEDAIMDDVTGFLIPQAQVTAALSDAIIRLLFDPALAQTMGAAGQKQAKTQTWDHVAQQMIVLYSKYLTG